MVQFTSYRSHTANTDPCFIFTFRPNVLNACALWLLKECKLVLLKSRFKQLIRKNKTRVNGLHVTKLVHRLNTIRCVTGSRKNGFQSWH